MEDTQPVCGLRICQATIPVLFEKLTLRHTHYLGRGGTPQSTIAALLSSNSRYLCVSFANHLKIYFAFFTYLQGLGLLTVLR